MTTINDFLTNKNINLIWDVINEEDIVKYSTNEIRNHFLL
jgi:hypothetical protein